MLQKRNKHLFPLEGSGFKKAMLEYFADCGSIIEKIEERAFKRKDLVEIVDYYNQFCDSKG